MKIAGYIGGILGLVSFYIYNILTEHEFISANFSVKRIQRLCNDPYYS